MGAKKMSEDIFEELVTIVEENNLSYFHASLYLMKKVEDENKLLKEKLGHLITAISGGMLPEYTLMLCDEIDESLDIPVKYEWNTIEFKSRKKNLQIDGKKEEEE